MNMFDDEVISELIDFLKQKKRKKAASSKEGNFLSAPRFIFVCGKKIIENEDTIRGYTVDVLKKKKNINEYNTQKDAVLCVISENLYVQDLAEDIFTFEKMLGELSDRIIIVAESPGSFCELGAFIMDDQCRRKTTVINLDDDAYKDSFITKGPIKKLENEDENSIILHNGIDRIRLSSEFDCKIGKIALAPLTIPINNNSKEINLKSLIYELTNIVEIFQPLERFEIDTIYKKINDFHSYTIKNTAGHKISTINHVLKLMERMQLIKKVAGYYFVNSNISCYNVLFTISRKDFNDLRILYLNRINKCQRQRLEIL